MKKIENFEDSKIYPSKNSLYLLLGLTAHAATHYVTIVIHGKAAQKY